MKTFKRLMVSLAPSLIAAVLLSVWVTVKTETKLGKGFAFGPPVQQQMMKSEGVLTVRRYGFPATYREVQTFRSTTGSYYETSYEAKPRSARLIATNVVFWMALFVALAAPVTIFYRPKNVPLLPKIQNEVDATEENSKSQVKPHANPRD